MSEDAINGDADREARDRAGEYGKAQPGAVSEEEAFTDDTYGLADADEQSASAGGAGGVEGESETDDTYGVAEADERSASAGGASGAEGGPEANDTYGVDEVDRQGDRGGRSRPGE